MDYQLVYNEKYLIWEVWENVGTGRDYSQGRMPLGYQRVCIFPKEKEAQKYMNRVTADKKQKQIQLF